MEGNDFSAVAFERENFLTSLNVPEFGGLVHGTGGNKHAVRIELKANDLHVVTAERVVLSASIRVPDLGFAIEGPSYNLVTKRRKIDTQ